MMVSVVNGTPNLSWRSFSAAQAKESVLQLRPPGRVLPPDPGAGQSFEELRYGDTDLIAVAWRLLCGSFLVMTCFLIRD